MRTLYVSVPDGDGFDFGMDAVTPVTFEFHNRPRHKPYVTYTLPAHLPGQPEFETWVAELPNKTCIMSLNELKAKLQTFPRT